MARVGRVARAHGIKGHVVVDADTDFPSDRFKVGAGVFVARGGEIVPLRVQAVRFQAGRPIVGFTGVSTMNEAQALAGHDLLVPVSELAALPEGSFYRHDLVGCRVETAAGDVVGIVREVEGPMGSSRLVVEAAGRRDRDVLIPLARAICPLIDTGARRIVIDPPEGLLDVNG